MSRSLSLANPTPGVNSQHNVGSQERHNSHYTVHTQTPDGLQHADIVMTTSECVSPTTQSNPSCKGVRRGGRSFLGCSPTSEGDAVSEEGWAELPGL